MTTFMTDATYSGEMVRLPAEEMEQLCVRVRRRTNGWVRGFRLVLRGHGLVLQGTAPSYYAKQLAQQAILETTPLPILANEIEVLSTRPAIR